MIEPVAVYIDDQFPEITTEIVDRVFDALRPGLSAPTERPDSTDPQAGWSAIGRLIAAMPFEALRGALGRLQRAEGPHADDAAYAFTWGFYHSRAEAQDFGEDD